MWECYGENAVPEADILQGGIALPKPGGRYIFSDKISLGGSNLTRIVRAGVGRVDRSRVDL